MTGPEPRKRLILLTQWFDPEPAIKGLVFAQALRDRGFDVEVVTGFPNYPGGRLYDSYRIRPIRREMNDGIAITRLALFPSHGRSALGRIANYLSFAFSAFVYLLFVARRADAVYVYHPPMTVGLAAACAGLLRRTPMLIDIQDMWPDTLRATGMIGNRHLLSAVGAACNWVYRRAAHIAVLSPGFRRLLIERTVPPGRISVIYNWADADALAERADNAPAALGAKGAFTVLFAGNMGRAQALDHVLDAAVLLRGDARINFVLLGGGLEADRLKARALNETIGNVRFVPKVPMHEVGDYLAAADCLLVHLGNDPLFSITIPSKTQAYMAAGKPVLMAVAGDAAALVAQADCGVVAAPENARALAAAVEKLAAMPAQQLAAMGKAGADFYRNQLALDKGADAFARLLHEIS